MCARIRRYKSPPVFTLILVFRFSKKKSLLGKQIDYSRRELFNFRFQLTRALAPKVMMSGQPGC